MSHWTITPLRTGQFINFEKSGFTYLMNQGVKVSAPCIAWLLRRDDMAIVVDTGAPLPDAIRRLHHRDYEATPDQRLVRQLERYGVEAQEVRTVLFTHLHYDHVHAPQVLPNARFLVQREELHYAAAPLPAHRRHYGLVGDEVPEWMGVIGRIEALDGDVEIAGGLSAHLLPGHTPGSQSIRIVTESGVYLIAGDTVGLDEAWNAPGGHIPTTTFVNLYDFYRTFRRMEEIADYVLPSHDVGVFKHACYPPHDDSGHTERATNE